MYSQQKGKWRKKRQLWMHEYNIAINMIIEKQIRLRRAIQLYHQAVGSTDMTTTPTERFLKLVINE